MPMFQKEREFFKICQKAYQFFNYFWIFQLCLTFANFKNIWAVLENLCRETKNLNFQFSKISLRKDLMNLEALMEFLTEHIRKPNNYSANVKWSWIYIFYLRSFVRHVYKGLFRKANILHTINLVRKAYIM